MPNKQGFTMIELLVTVLLIGILAAMALPQYVKVVEKQKGTEAVNILASIGKAQERYFAVNEKYTTDFSDLDADLIDFNTKSAADGSSYNTKYFVFLLDGTDDNVSKVKATRRGNESYIIERNYTTGEVCCKNDNTADGDICDVLDLPNDTCSSSGGGSTGGGSTGGGSTGGGTSCSGAQPTDTQACASGCGTQTRSVTCSSGSWVTGSWTGTCTSPTQTQPTSQSCGTSGTQTRTCTPSCGGGTCGAWSTCSSQACTATQPAATQACASGCGTQTRSVTCNNGTWETGSWTGTCTSPTQTQPTSQSCGSGGTQTRTCTADCNGGTCGAWSTCETGKTACPATCPDGQKRDANINFTEDGNCCVAKTACPATCPTGQQRDTSINFTEDGNCCIAKTACPSACPAGQKRDANINFTEDGNCCVAKTACPATCPAGKKRDTSVSYTEDGTCCIAKTACPTSCPAGKKRNYSISYTEDGTCCVSLTANVYERPLVVRFNPSTYSPSSYEWCYGSGGWAAPDDYATQCEGASQDKCANGFMVEGRKQEYRCLTPWSEASGWPWCSGSNYQGICNTKEQGYHCKISESSDDPYDLGTSVCNCDWTNQCTMPSFSGGCYTIFLGGKGTGEFLACE